MAKDKARKIKTSRYWTRTCENCKYEFPNWFVQCPRCKHVWGEKSNEGIQTQSIKAEIPKDSKLKTVRIIANIDEEEVRISSLTIYFSGDNGISWFQMPMIRENDYFVAEIQNVPTHSTIIYYLRGVDEKGMEFIEDNNAEFYYYNVFEELEEENVYSKAQEPEIESPPISNNTTPILKEIKEDIEEGPVQISTPSFAQQSERKASQYNPSSSGGVIFTPLNQIKKDVKLRECPNCKSKVKSDWAACPICGYRF